MTFIEILVIVVCALVVIGVIIKGFIDKKKGKTSLLVVLQKEIWRV